MPHVLDHQYRWIVQATARRFHMIATAFGGLATPPGTYTRQRSGSKIAYTQDRNHSHSAARWKRRTSISFPPHSDSQASPNKTSHPTATPIQPNTTDAGTILAVPAAHRQAKTQLRLHHWPQQQTDSPKPIEALLRWIQCPRIVTRVVGPGQCLLRRKAVRMLW